MARRDLATLPPYLELDDWCDDAELIELASSCIEAQRRAAEETYRARYRPEPEAAGEAVSTDRLGELLEAGRDVHGISRQPEISNVIAFADVSGSGRIVDPAVNRLRRRVDRAMAELIRRSFTAPARLAVASSGHFWYPRYGYMAWHTNSGAPGWRIYLSHAEEPGKSFFRYRDPATGEIVTSLDREWTFRMFEIRADRPLWHAVYSETNRYSLGYMLHAEMLLRGFVRRLRARIAG